MKAEIHPNYKNVEVVCSCGNTFTTRSTYKGETLKLDVCGKCHPFYSGKHRVVDSAGQIDRFMSRYGSYQAKTQSE